MNRAPNGSDRRLIPTQTRLSKETREELRRTAEKRDVTVAQIIRERVEALSTQTPWRNA